MKKSLIDSSWDPIIRHLSDQGIPDERIAHGLIGLVLGLTTDPSGPLPLTRPVTKKDYRKLTEAITARRRQYANPLRINLPDFSRMKPVADPFGEDVFVRIRQAQPEPKPLPTGALLCALMERKWAPRLTAFADYDPYDDGGGWTMRTTFPGRDLASTMYRYSR